MAFMLLWVCSVIGHIKCQHVVRTWVIVKKSYPKNLSAYCRSTVHGQSADRFFGALFFTITRTWMTHSLNGSFCDIFVCYTFWHDLLSITEQTCHHGIYLLMSIVVWFANENMEDGKTCVLNSTVHSACMFPWMQDSNSRYFLCLKFGGSISNFWLVLTFWFKVKHVCYPRKISKFNTWS